MYDETVSTIEGEVGTFSTTMADQVITNTSVTVSLLSHTPLLQSNNPGLLASIDDDHSPHSSLSTVSSSGSRSG